MVNFLFSDIDGNFPKSSCNEITTLKDKLWKKNCFEFFVKSPHDEKYIEWNFSTNGEYAVYFFDGIRTLADIKLNSFDIKPISICYSKNSHASFSAKVNLQKTEGFIGHLSGNLIIKPCMIVQRSADKYFYLAQRHNKTSPDFHDFTYEKNLL